MPPTPPPKPFDPFAIQRVPAGTKHWLLATAVQALVTLALVGFAKYGEGKPWESHARLITLFGIIATWSLALRAIREHLVQLLRVWHKASAGLLNQASKSGRHLINVKLSGQQEQAIKDSIWRLRIIAAGLSIPFFLMPLFWMVLSVCFHFSMQTIPAQSYWASIAIIMSASAAIVAGYVHWVLVPIPALAPVRVSGYAGATPFKRRRRD